MMRVEATMLNNKLSPPSRQPTMKPRISERAPRTPNDDVLWQAVMERDPRFDGVLYYGVSSTGIYCRPVCPSRRPYRENVVFFTNPNSAKAAGFSSCKRCRPDLDRHIDDSHRIVLQACRRIEADGDVSSSIGQLADQVGVTERRLRALFRRVLDTSPKRYAEAFRTNRFFTALKSEESVTGAIYAAGYGAPSRLYERATHRLGMTPSAYKRGGVGETIYYQVAKSALGILLVAGTEKGLCCV